jgi:transposase
LTNDATRLLGLDGVAVTSVVTGKDGNPMLALVTVDEQARCCPDCGIRSERPHSWVTTKPRDLPVAGRQAELIWNKRRWRCQEAVCPRKTFTEALPQIPSRAGLTCRLRESAGAGVSDLGRTVIQSARDHHVSWPIAQAAFAAHAKNALPATTPLTERLGIDETRRGKAKFRLTDAGDAWEVTADRWHAGFVDLSGGAGLLGQVEGRTAKSVSAWIKAQTPEWRAGVRFVAIDMCAIFKSAVRTSLPHAILVVDRFHIAQLANAAVTEVRRRVTVQQRGRRGRKGNREWELPSRLTRSAAKIHAEHLDPVVDDRAPAVPVLRVLCRLRPSRAGAPGRHCEHLVARDRGRDHLGRQQRRLGRDQQIDQDRRQSRLRLPQPRQPVPPSLLRHDATITRTPHHPNEREARSTSMSRRTISWQLRAAMAAQERGAVFTTREAPELVLHDRTSGLKATLLGSDPPMPAADCAGKSRPCGQQMRCSPHQVWLIHHGPAAALWHAIPRISPTRRSSTP